LAMIDAAEIIQAFARRHALSALHLWDAPQIVREYLETGDDSKRKAAWIAMPTTIVFASSAACEEAAWAAIAVANDDYWEAGYAAELAREATGAVMGEAEAEFDSLIAAAF
jgi:hypothetical protein